MAGSFVLDCSVVMSWCFEDESDAYGDAVLSALEQAEATAPGILPLEIGNVLVVAERHRRITTSDSARFISLFQNLPISIAPEPPDRALREIYALARSSGLSTYDASYLDLAMRMGVPLATRDKVLRAAAERCGVQLFAGVR